MRELLQEKDHFAEKLASTGAKNKRLLTRNQDVETRLASQQRFIQDAASSAQPDVQQVFVRNQRLVKQAEEDQTGNQDLGNKINALEAALGKTKTERDDFEW